MGRVTLKNLLARKGRMVLTAIAIVLGVSLVSGTYVLTDTLDGVFTNLMTESTAGVDVYVRSESSFNSTMSFGAGRAPVPEDVLLKVRVTDGVQMAFGSVSGIAQILDREGKVIKNGGSPTLGMSWSPPPLSSAHIVSGRAPRVSGEVAIDAASAEKGGFKVGENIDVMIGGPVVRSRLSGIISFGSANNLAGATMVVLDLKSAQLAFDKVGFFDAIEVLGDPGIGAEELRGRLAAVLPESFEAITGSTLAAEWIDSVDVLLGYLNTALLVFALIALFVGAFIIFNTFSIVVAQRSREFALLRSLGARPRQITIAVVVEAFIVGAVASVLGVVLGIGVAAGLESLLKAFGMDLPSGGLKILPRTVTVSMILGVGVTTLSALVPARRAAKISPLALMREAASPFSVSLGRRVVWGAGAMTLGVLALFAGLFTEVGQPLAYVGAGALLSFLGLGILSPMLTAPVARMVGAVPARIAGVAGTLARENAQRNTRRTATTAAALMVGIALVTFVAIFSSSIKSSVTSDLDKTMKADVVVMEEEQMTALGFSPAVEEVLASLPEVSSIAPVRLGEWGYKGSSRFLSAIDPQQMSESLDLGADPGALARLGAEEVLVFEPTADEMGLEAGDVLPMQFTRTGTIDAQIAGTYSEASAINAQFLISLDMYERNFTEQRDLQVYVRGAPGVAAQDLKAAVTEAISGFPGLSVLNSDELKDNQAKQIDRMLGLITALLGLAIIIAVVGIANTLGLSILERTRELGLLRAVGMTRKQLRSMIRWEAIITALFGSGLGLLVGVFFGWAVTYSLKDQGIDATSIPTTQLIVYLALGAVTGVIASLVPGRRAARMDVLKAVTVE